MALNSTVRAHKHVTRQFKWSRAEGATQKRAKTFFTDKTALDDIADINGGDRKNNELVDIEQRCFNSIFEVNLNLEIVALTNQISRINAARTDILSNV